MSFRTGRPTGLFAAIWPAFVSVPAPLKKSDDRTPRGKPLTASTLWALSGGAAALFALSYISYLPTLEPIETPEDIHERLGVLIELTFLSCFSFVAGLNLHFYATASWERHWEASTSPIPKLSTTQLSQRASLALQWPYVRGLVLRALPLAYPLLLAATDFGSRLDRHGAYNLIAFVALAVPVLVAVSLLTACVRRLHLSRQQVLAVCCGAAVFIVYWSLSLRTLRDEWHVGIAGQRMLEGGEAVAAEAAGVSSKAEAAAGVLPGRLRAARAVAEAEGGRGGGSSSSESAGPCSWDYSRIWLPLYDSSLMRSTVRTVTGVAAPCRGPVIEAFSLEVLEPAEGVGALGSGSSGVQDTDDIAEAEAALFSDSSIAAAAAAEECNARDSSLYRPVSVRVRGCPASLRLRYRLPKDARMFLAEPKHGESALQRAVYTSQPLIDTQALRQPDGSAVIRIGTSVYGESIEVHCGGGPDGVDGSGPLARAAAAAAAASSAPGASGSSGGEGASLAAPAESAVDPSTASDLSSGSSSSSASGSGSGYSSGAGSGPGQADDGEIEYASFVRPRRDVLIRLHRWWGRSPLQSAPLPALASARASAAGPDQTVSRRSTTAPNYRLRPSGPDGRRPPNVLHIMLDAVSRLQARRQLPLTIALLEELQLANNARSARGSSADASPAAGGADVVELFRLHSNGATTGPNAGVLLTGEWDAHPGSEMLWEKAMRRAGYVGAALYGMCEDFAGEYLQFSTQSDHEPGAMFCAAEAYPLGSPTSLWSGPYSSTRRCMRGRAVHERSIEWSSQFWRTYAGAPKWLLLTLLEGHESTGEVLSTADADLAAFLRRLLIKEGGARDTVVVIQADHGLHMGAGYLLTAQGRIEHMNPAAWIVLPPQEDLPALDATARTALRANAQRLVTQADIFMTLHQLMTAPLGRVPEAVDGSAVAAGAAESSWMPQPALPPRCEADAPDMRKRPDRTHTQHLPRGDAPAGAPLPPASWTAPVLPGVSLLGPEPLPLSRSCADAGIKAKYCRCV